MDAGKYRALSNEFRELREIQGDREWVMVGSGH